MTLEISTPAQKGTLQASKWIQYYLLLKDNELKKLFETLNLSKLYCTSQIDREQNLTVTPSEYVSLYREYLLSSQSHKEFNSLKKRLTVALDFQEGAFYKIAVKESQCLIKNVKPVIEIKPFALFYNETLKQFFYDLRSEEAFDFGIEIRFPSVYQNSVVKALEYTAKEKSVSSQAFKKLRQFIREHTTRLKLLAKGQPVYTLVRIGDAITSKEIDFLLLKRQNILRAYNEN